MERRLKIASYFSIFLIAVSIVDSNSGSNLSEICMTNTCIKEAERVSSTMNKTIDPCDNFYEFACGSFLKNNNSIKSVYSILTNQLEEILYEPIIESEIEPFKDAKRLYKACTDTDSIEKLGTASVEIVLDSIGGWPAVVGDKWNQEDKWTWQQATTNLYKGGHWINYLVSLYVVPDDKNNTKRMLQIDSPYLGINPRNLLDENYKKITLANYKSYQVDLAVLFGASRAFAENEMADALIFETELAKISTPSTERRDITKLYNLRRISQLQSDYPYIEWLQYFKSILPTESQLQATDIVIVRDLSFFEKLGDLLEKTPRRTIANYFAWRIALHSVDYLPESFRKRQLEYKKVTTGQTRLSHRWFECVNTVLKFFPHAVGALYVRKHFKKESKENVLEMVNNIKAELINTFSESTWMDEMTKREALKKAKAIDAQIGFADELMDDQKILEYHNGIPATIVEDRYYESVMRVVFAKIVWHNKRLKEPVAIEWSSQESAATIDAFYIFTKNAIVFPAGILQGLFFKVDRPQYMNYGGIGSLIGHEIIHGFDEENSQRDAQGNLRNWWTNDTRNAYMEKAQCLIEQYGNYTEPLTKLNLNGIDTLEENIADNGGTKQSYRAYVRWAKENSEQKLPGLNYTPQQMFWISAGQMWCVRTSEKAMRNMITTADHSPNRFRVIGMMSNSKEFASDFKCSATSKMNPKDKCEVW